MSRTHSASHRSSGRPNRLRRAILGVVALLGGATTAACAAQNSSSSSEPAAAPTPVTLVLDWSPNTNHAGIYLAQSRGWYTDQGIELRIVQPGADGGLQALATAQADFAVSVQEELTPARAAGVPVVSIAAIIAHNTSSLLSLKTDDITRPKDLMGRRYGGWGGQLERAIIDKLVACDGGDGQAVTIVTVGDADYRVGLEQDHYDAVWVFDGWDKIRFQQAGVAVNTVAFADYPDCIPDWYTPLLAASEQTIENRPDLVGTFLAATRKGYAAAIDDPEAAAEALLSAAPELDRELVTASARYLSTRFASSGATWGRQDPAVWRRFTAFLDEAGLLQAPVDAEAAFTNRFLSAPDASADAAPPDR